MAENEKSLLTPADLRILAVLQDDASLPVAEVARRTGMSPTPCWRRIRRMKDAGLIRQVAAIVDREKAGLGFVAYAFVKLALPSRDNMDTFDALVRGWPEVVICERVTGAVDYLIKVVAADMKAYDDFLRLKLLDGELVSDVQSRIVVSTVKDSVALPL